MPWWASGKVEDDICGWRPYTGQESLHCGLGLAGQRDLRAGLAWVGCLFRPTRLAALPPSMVSVFMRSNQGLGAIKGHWGPDGCLEKVHGRSYHRALGACAPSSTA